MSSSSSSNPRSVCRQHRKQGELCDCGFRINPRTSWTHKNPGRRFLSCPVLDERKKCRLFQFMDEELPSQYYKDLVFELHNELEGLRLNCNSELVEELQVTRMEGLKTMEELKMAKAKLKVFEWIFMLLVGIIVVLCFLVGGLSM